MNKLAAPRQGSPPGKTSFRGPCSLATHIFWSGYPKEDGGYIVPPSRPLEGRVAFDTDLMSDVALGALVVGFALDVAAWVSRARGDLPWFLRAYMTSSFFAIWLWATYPFLEPIFLDFDVSRGLFTISLAGSVFAAMLGGGVADLFKRHQPLHHAGDGGER